MGHHETARLLASSQSLCIAFFLRFSARFVLTNANNGMVGETENSGTEISIAKSGENIVFVYEISRHNRATEIFFSDVTFAACQQKTEK